MKEQYEELTIYYSNRSDGNMSKKFGEEADLNRRNFISRFGLPLNRFLFMQPNNRDKIVELKEDVNETDLYYKLVEADAIVCPYPNIYLYLHFADCIPFTIYDCKNKIFAFAHLGWRSTYLNLHQKLFATFKEKYQSSVEDLIICIGPSIKKESYLLPNPKQKEETVWEPYITYVKDDLYQVDLRGYVSDFFYRNGFKKEQVFISEIDTCANQEFFSHYRVTLNPKEQEGRFFYCVAREE